MVRVIITYLLIIFTYPFFTGCGQGTMHTHGVIKDTANCILFGAESMTYYYGDSAKAEEKKEGSIYDHVFMSYVLSSIKRHSKDTSFKVAIKPLASADVMANVAAVIDIFNTNSIQNRYIDKAWLPQPPDKVKLNLPADDNSSNNNDKKIKNIVSLILCGGDILYVYEGNDINSGTKYTFETIDKFLKSEMKKFAGKEYIIAIKPTDNSNYKETVDILDKMKLNDIDKYALMDVTDEENLFVKSLKQ